MTQRHESLANIVDSESNRPVRVSPNSQRLRVLVNQMAHSFEVPDHALRHKLLLHLPRIATDDGTVSVSAAISEARRLGALIPHSESWGSRPRTGSHVRHSLRLQVDLIDESDARSILTNFHYLGSHRHSSTYYAARAKEAERPIALVVCSPFDLQGVRKLLPYSDDTGRIRTVSRVFCFDNAPRNTISYVLSQVAKRERNEHGTEVLTTYINPNLGFNGASYRASGWDPIGSEPGTTYRYLDKSYVTDRWLKDQFGTVDDVVLSAAFRARYKRSQMHLASLIVFARPLTPSARELLATDTTKRALNDLWEAHSD